MPRKTDPSAILQDLQWIKHLPDEGGAWGRGLLATVEAAARQVSHLEASRKELDRQIAASLTMVRRKNSQAEQEAKLCFTQEQIVEAQVAAENAAQEPAEDGEEAPQGEENDAPDDNEEDGDGEDENEQDA